MAQKPEGVLSFLDTVRINSEGWPFIAAFAAVALVLFFVWGPLGWIGVVATIWCVYFFRDPERVTPVREGLLVSPADGIVTQIVPALPPRELEMGDTPRTRISVFLNVFDVHVNRMPGGGRVVKRAYRPGKFVNASFDKASEDNERLALRIRLDQATPQPQTDIAVVQIAGLVARRIRCWVAEGDAVVTGQRYGMIRFGSRTDIYLPPDTHPLVSEGQRMVGGETVIADLASDEPPRRGASR